MRKLIEKIKEKKSAVVVGLDPRVDQLPGEIRAFYKLDDQFTLEAAAEAFLAFNKGIIDAVHDLVPAVKPQIAFYEALGVAGYKAYAETVAYAQEKGFYVIGDIKRGDIGSTSVAYAKAHFEVIPTDSITINPYLGVDGIEPFLQYAREAGKGLFILVKTSNPSSSQLQDRDVEGANLYSRVASLVTEWGADCKDETGYSPVGAVVGATHPSELTQLRSEIPHGFFLIPGYGAQGGGGADVVGGFDQKGLGALVNSSRGIIFAYQKRGGDFRQAARQAVVEMNADINGALEAAGKAYWK